MNKVGIVILNYNSMNYLPITLESLMIARGNVPFVVGVIDNGSSPQERDACEQLVNQYIEKYTQQEFIFIDAGQNLGFSGGNNVVIKKFMEREDITHICLLNSDVIVTDFWLDYLLEKDQDVIGPVTNAAGNEQTIQIDYTVENNTDAIYTANKYAEKRHECYSGYVVYSELVTFFATVIRKSVIETIGLLDEQFYPGSYEDDDYCLRILEAGYQIAIARDCFLHHFGSGSFSKLNMSERMSIGNVNRERFEKKWNRAWQDRTWKLLESCKQDVDYLLDKDDKKWQCTQLDSSFTEIEKLIDDWGNAIRFFTAKADQGDVTVCEYSAKQLIRMLLAKIKRKCIGLYKGTIGKIDQTLKYNRNLKESKQGIERIYQLIHTAQKNGHNPICVFAPMYNKENERDGYIQRIKAIDQTVLVDMCRIYLYDEGTENPAMRFDIIDDLHGYIVFNSHNAYDLNAIKKLVHDCGVAYTHSILRFMEDRTSKELWDIFDDVEVKHFWDVHGTVPEEYAMSGSELGSKLAENIEQFMANRVDVAVVVTEAMANYLRKKYTHMTAEFMVVPILNEKLLQPSKNTKSGLQTGISIVYAGGTQPWQNIGLMQDIIEQTDLKYHYKIFVPDPDEFMKLWGNRKATKNMEVGSKAPEDLYHEYESCDLGFVLRDADPVNLVACPTKIIEYLKFGIIPVLKTIEIGDFVHLGMKYISYTDVIAGLRISDKERDSIVENNYQVLDKLSQIYVSGISNLKKMVQDPCENYSVTAHPDKPNIGIVVTTFEKGGLEQVVLNLYLGYKQKGYKVYLLCQKDILGVMAEQIDKDELFVFYDSIKSFMRYVQMKQISVLHYHYNTFGCQAAKEKGIHTIYTMHNVYTWKNDKEIQEYSKVLNTMDMVIPVSNLVKEYYLGRTNARQDNLYVIYNGIDFTELGNKELPGFLNRQNLGLMDTDIVIGFVASFYPVKYQIGMIGVMEELISRYPSVKLLFIGNCENDYYKKFLLEYEKSPARNNMILVPYFEHKYMGEFMRRIVDIFTLPTLQEGCSNAVLEAIYCDKPMVLTNVGNAKDVEYLKSCVVVNAAYKDIITTSNEQILSISEKKDSLNKMELVDAFSQVIEHLNQYKEAAKLSMKEKEIYETTYMVTKYIEIIEKIIKQ